MAIALTPTLVGADFDAIFTECSHPSTLQLVNPSQLRLFYLDTINGLFDYAGLEEFILDCLGDYVFSRAEIEDYIQRGKTRNIGLYALRRLRQQQAAGQIGSGSDLGEILLYVFLEKILGAPKIMSKIELSRTGGTQPSRCDAIHLRPPNPSENLPYNTIVFGTSEIVDDIEDAIDDAFERINHIQTNQRNEVLMAENMVFEKVFDDRTTHYIKDLLIPAKDRGTKRDIGYGIFLGYKLGLNPSAYSSGGFDAQLVAKMRLDIAQHADLIMRKINELNLANYSFYIYVLPLNLPSTDRIEIMNHVLDQGGQL